MGVIYLIIPLTESVAEDVRGQGLTVPHTRSDARNPTFREIRAACESLPGMRGEFRPSANGKWQHANLRGPDGLGNADTWTELSVSGYDGRDDQPLSVGFSKGWPSLILVVVRELAKACGPLVVYPDTGDAPVVVEAESSVEVLLKSWEHTHGQS
ncbi:hypothetical protein [Humisphaera borealis]|uniref:Uncharacterized protein n=1 Tax=Humisphaera borealis TaxID=2807512 RepID=A0A7M2WS89_9BACT|nr:hypothetical protein [Humisphaera borealis]QOV88042.1 hypothetical protein IPV69_17455 [Humisphaera borealis]